MVVKRDNAIKYSEYLQLRFSVADQLEGTAKVYKTMLINSRPRVIRMVKYVEASVGRMISIDLSNIFDDPDGDALTLTMP